MPGQPARVYVAGERGRFLEGRVERVANQAEFTPRDVHMPDERATLVFAVDIRMTVADAALSDGFPADVYIRWDPSVAWPAAPPW
jgi:HlyD family secretion protein